MNFQRSQASDPTYLNDLMESKMKTTTTIALLAALALALPATLVVGIQDANAQSTLDSASKEGKRTHKRANAKRTNTSSSSKKSTKSKTTTTRTTRTVGQQSGYRATETRVYRSSGQTYHRSYRPTTTRTVHHYSRSRPTYTHVHHSHRTYQSDYGQPVAQTQATSNIDVFINGGVGISGFASNTITDDALPGIGWNFAIGGKGEYIGMEFGLDGGGYTFDPQGTNETELGLFGLYFDLKLQPTIAGFFEPYVFAGLGGYVLSDAILVENTSGGAYRLGLGANLRFENVAIGGKYLYQGFGFADDSGIYGGDFSGNSETVSLGLTFYF